MNKDTTKDLINAYSSAWDSGVKSERERVLEIVRKYKCSEDLSNLARLIAKGETK